MDKPFEEMTPFEQKQAKVRTIFKEMQETVRASQRRFLNHSKTRKEAKKKMFNLDASIEEEVKKRPPRTMLKSISKTNTNRPFESLSTILSEEPAEEIIEETAVKEESEAVEEKPKFLPPDPANTNLDDLMDALDVVSGYLNNAKNEIQYFEECIHNTDYETTDFMHSIELSSFTPEEKIDIFNKVSEIRRRRRSYKARLEYLYELNTFLDNNENVSNRINALRGQLRRIKEKQRTARYFSKIRNDIKEDANVHVGTVLHSYPQKTERKDR